MAELAALESLDPAALAGVRLLATDVDGTLTRAGALESDVVAAIAALGDAGVEVLPVSGRPCGELTGLVRYLPGVKRGIAENGLLLVRADRAPEWLDPPTDLERLRAVGEHLNRTMDAGLELTADAYMRRGDVAYERAGRDEAELTRLRDAAEAEGVHLIWSNVHIHLAQASPDKGRGLAALLEREGSDPGSVVSIGDAPNDGGLFRPGTYRACVGTADVREALAHFPRAPSHISARREGDAFIELAELLLKAAFSRA